MTPPSRKPRTLVLALHPDRYRSRQEHDYDHEQKHEKGWKPYITPLTLLMMAPSSLSCFLVPSGEAQ